MPPRMIKVCGITTAEDAAAAVAGGATAIGFNFYPNSKRYITPEAAAGIARDLPGGVTKVGVFVNETAAEMERVAALVPLDVAQLHGDEAPDQAPRTIRFWKAFRVDERFDAARFELYPQAEAFLLDGPAGAEYGGSGKPFAWSLAAGSPRKIVIAGGLDASNVGEAIRQARPWGVDACSRIESAPGRKDHRKMSEFLKAALCEDL
ncbi:MAG: phosphoribosylanthranilate isomerase [Bryobacterales bacterium]|nr:phosphoribosylanthranilate isomerase [Bryobacterales bacterium]